MNIKREIALKFDLSDLGKLTRIVGCEVKHDRNAGTMVIVQTQYINILLSRYGLDKGNVVESLLNPSAWLQRRDSEEPDITLQGQYSALIGLLLYIAQGTHPNISFAVQMLCQFSLNPLHQHLTAAKRVLCYLKCTIDVGIVYQTDRTPLRLIAFSNSDWGTDTLDRKSISGYVFQLTGGPITWSSKKQATVALSSMEAEYVAMSHCVRAALWLRNLFDLLGILGKDPVSIHADNMSAISHVKNHMATTRSRHIDIRLHFIRDAIDAQLITIHYCESKENATDILTKVLSAPTHWHCLDLLGMHTELRGSVAAVEANNSGAQ